MPEKGANWMDIEFGYWSEEREEVMVDVIRAALKQIPRRSGGVFYHGKIHLYVDQQANRAYRILMRTIWERVQHDNGVMEKMVRILVRMINDVVIHEYLHYVGLKDPSPYYYTRILLSNGE